MSEGVVFNHEEEEFNKYLINHTLKQIVDDPTVPQNLRNKLNDAILYEQMQEPTSSGNLQTLFGLSELEPPEFTVDEHNTITNLLHNRLQEYLLELQYKAKVEDQQTHITLKILTETREQLMKTITIYGNNLIEYNKLLESVYKFQSEKLPHIYNEFKIKSKLKEKVNQLKFTLIKLTVQLQIQNENEVSHEAYKELINRLKEQQEETKHKIKGCKEMLVKYKLAECKEFEAVLKEYLQYQTAIEKFLRMKKLIDAGYNAS